MKTAILLMYLQENYSKKNQEIAKRTTIMQEQYRKLFFENET